MRRKLAPCCSRITTERPRRASGSGPSPSPKSRPPPAKPRARKTEDGEPVHGYHTLLADLATLTRNSVRFGDNLPITVLARPTPLQQRAFDLLGIALAP
jgi:hypothetical protein